MAKKEKKKKLGSLSYQLIERLKSMACIGESRKDAKKEAREQLGFQNGRTVGIHSYKSFDKAKTVSKGFADYVKENYPGIKDINNIDDDIIIDYIEYRATLGLSQKTVDTDRTILNKIFNKNITKKQLGHDKFSYKDIVKGRSENVDLKYNYDNWKDQIDVVRGTGIRRSSVTKITKENFIRNNLGQCVAIKVKEKGGKERIAPILSDFRGSITDIVNNAKEGETIFKKFTTKINAHALRREYALNLYNELEQGKHSDYKKYGLEKAWRRGVKTQGDFRGYNAENLAVVSQALGHNRLDVVVYNYCGVRKEK